jgi:uncharacterized protein
MTIMRLLLLALCASAPALAAQVPDRAVFLVRQNAETLAVERAAWNGREIEARLLLRSPLMRIVQYVTLDDAGAVSRIVTEMSPGAAGDTVRQRAELVFRGDSGYSRAGDPRATTPPPGRAFAVARGSVPLLNLSGISLELLVRRARAIGGETARVPVLLVTGQSITALVTRRGDDSLIVTMGGVVLHARADIGGRLLGAVVPSQNVVFERLPGNSRVAAWTPVPVSYAAPPGAPYTAQEVTVRTPAGITLAGTLTLPARGRGRRLPAVVLITGSGAQDRDESSPSLEKWRPFRQIADTLSRRGVAVLRLDDRGVGGSSAGPAGATSADFADDVRAAVAWLRARPEIDPARVGLVGHSEGGMIAPMVAATDRRLGAIALLAGTASRGRDIIAAQRRYLLDADTTLSRARRDSLFAAAAKEADSAFAAPGWMHFFADYDPLATARRVRVPVLILQGETDRQVPVAEARRLAAALRAGGNRRVTLRTFPRVNHLLVEDPSGDPRGYARLPRFDVRSDLLGALADWLARTL